MRIGSNELIIIFLALVPRLLMLIIPIVIIGWSALHAIRKSPS